MPLDSTQYKALVITQVGDDADGTLAAQIDTLWTANDNQALLAGQFLYTKRDAIDVMLAKVRTQIDFTDPAGVSAKLDQLFQHLLRMRADTQAAIVAGGADPVASADSAQGAAAGELTTTTSLPAPLGQMDGNDPAYRGSLYAPRRVRP